MKVFSAAVAAGVVMMMVSAGGCASKPAGLVSESELKQSRDSYSKLPIGTPRDEALAKLGAGNRVKLGSAAIDSAMIEEWKYEAFVDRDKGRELFVTFLYFCDGKLVDTSDTRIDFRNNAELVTRWRGVAHRRD